MSETGKILIIDDETIALENLMLVLEDEGYDVTGCAKSVEALELIEKHLYDLVLTDLKMEKVDGFKILTRVKEVAPDSEVIMITGYATVDSAIKAMKLGAYHYIAKPFKLAEVRKVVREAMEKVSLKQENRSLRQSLSELKGTGGIVTQNRDMKRILQVAAQAAISDSNILISGESGTGKELFARYIHSSSHRSQGPMVSINCGAFNEELLTNELFGHMKGAYTGAVDEKKGLIEKAQGGTLFLDEITEMSPGMQVKLLRVLQEKEVLRLGDTKPVSVDVRFIAATNRNIKYEVKEGHFRQDLFFRINVVAISLPSLAERKEDIVLLAQHFLEKFSAKMGKQVSSISPQVIDILLRYDFPGNIRELENIIERGVAMTGSEQIDLNHLPEDLRGMLLKTFRRKGDGTIPSLLEHEKSYIEWVMKESEGNKTLAAQHLGIDRVSLWRKMKKYDL